LDEGCWYGSFFESTKIDMQKILDDVVAETMARGKEMQQMRNDGLAAARVLPVLPFEDAELN